MYGTTHINTTTRGQLQPCSIQHCVEQLIVIPNQDDNSPAPYSTVCVAHFTVTAYQNSSSSVLYSTIGGSANCHTRSRLRQSCSCGTVIFFSHQIKFVFVIKSHAVAVHSSVIPADIHPALRVPAPCYHYP